MRKSSKAGKGAPKLEQAPVNEGVDDVKVKAVNEMMERIKHGVVLRPVKGQDTKRFGTKQTPPTEDRQQESAMEELKGILEVKKSPSRGFQEMPPLKKDSELEVILRRRRKQACDTASGEMGGHISKVSSSDSLNGRHSSDSGKETDGPGGGSDSGRETDGPGGGSDSGRETDGPGGGSFSGSETGSRSSSDSGREAIPTQSCADQDAEPNEPRQTTAFHTPLSEKGTCGPVDDNPSSWVQKDGDQEKTERLNQTQPLSEEPQGALGSAADPPSTLNISRDAEC